MENLSRRVNQMCDKRDARNMYLLLEPLYQRLRSVALSNAGLEISVTTTQVRNGNLFHYIAEGIKRRITADTDLPELEGTVANTKFNVFVFTVDKAGELYVQMGGEGDTEATIVWPALDQTRAIIGMIIINPTSGNFVGGTTALNAAGLNVDYISPVGVFEPTASI